MVELADATLLAGLPPVEVARLIGELEERTYPAGAVVFSRGDPAARSYIIRSGVAEARAGPGDEDEYPVALYEPGGSFGEAALLTDEPRSSTVVALTELQTWELPKERFLVLVNQVPGLALAVGRAVSRRLQATHQAVSTLHPTFDAMAEEEYAGLDPELQHFLRRTAPLDPIPVAVVERALGRADAGQVLAYLAARLPLVSAETNGTYRYHHLFRELLDDKLQIEIGVAGRLEWLGHLAECASALEQTELAIRLLVGAGDVEAAEKLAAARLRALVGTGELDSAEQLLASLPAPLDSDRGPLLDARADLLAAHGNTAGAVALLERAVRTSPGATGPAESALQSRYRRLAELSFDLGRSRDGLYWLREAEGGRPGSGAEGEDLEQIVAGSRDGQGEGVWPTGAMLLAALRGLRHVSSSVGVFGGQGIPRVLGLGLALLLALFFLISEPPPGLSREAFLALGTLVASLPLLVFSVFGDHLIALLMVAAWAGLGLVPAEVALSGFASPGWFLVLAVLALGAALGQTGLLYRVVLALLAQVPPRPVVLALALAFAGVLFSPAMPNATARTALAAPLAVEMAEALGYPRRSRGSALLGLALLLGFGQMCTLFLTGSSSGLLVHSLLPAESRARFGFVGWFLAAFPLHLIIFALSFGVALFVLRPEAGALRSKARLNAQLKALGPVRRSEWITLATLLGLVLAFVVGPRYGLEPAWAAVLAMVALGAAGVLDAQGFKSGINWSFLIFFGVMLSLANVFETLEIDAWLAAAAARPLAPLSGQPALFLVAVALAGYLLSLVVRWQAGSVLMSLVLIPVAMSFGLEPWVVGMTALVATNTWFFPYQSTIYQAAYYGANEQAFTHAQARPIALAYGFACLIGLVLSVPIWRAMGLLP